MIRQALEARGIILSVSEYEKVLSIAWDDVKFNYFNFRRILTFNELIDVIARCAVVLEKCA